VADRELAERRIGDRRDPVALGVGHVQRAARARATPVGPTASAPGSVRSGQPVAGSVLTAKVPLRTLVTYRVVKKPWSTAVVSRTVDRAAGPLPVRAHALARGPPLGPGVQPWIELE